MDNLLDTHTLLWYIDGDSSLSANAKRVIESADIINFVSIASIWEISIKVSLGKLLLKTSLSQLAYYISFNGFEIIPVTFKDTLIIQNLPFYHRDPFDRMIIAQAINNNLQIISKDNKFSAYNASIIW